MCAGRSPFARMCSQSSRKVHTVQTLSVPGESCTWNTRNGGSMDTEPFVGQLEIHSVDGKAWYSYTGAEANIIPREIYVCLTFKYRN